MAQLEALRTQHAEELQRFLRRLDHELKNPLTAIRFALANLACDDQDQAVIASIESQILRISHLITDLRKLADLDQLAVEMLPVEVEPLLTEAVALGQENTPDREHHITVEVGTSNRVRGDKYLLLLAVYNLIDNALKFTPPDTAIRVETWDDGDYVAIAVADNGPGIPPDDLPHVWEELYRSQTVRHIAGSGLGLAMVKAIVERHGGSVELLSTNGTTITLYLPMA